MANTDRARKLLVRTALVTSTTIATIVGAQNLAMMDANQFLGTATPTTQNVLVMPLVTANTATAASQITPEPTILRAAPSIIILRQSGALATALPAAGSTTSSAIIQPPAPVQMAAPVPVIVQQPVPQQSRSSR